MKFEVNETTKTFTLTGDLTSLHVSNGEKKTYIVTVNEQTEGKSKVAYRMQGNVMVKNIDGEKALKALGIANQG